MERKMLIAATIILTAMFAAGAMIKGSGYMYHVRDEDGISSVCVTPGETELYTIAFATGTKTADYYLLLVDLDDENERYPHVGVDGTHIEVVSLNTSINANATFAGDLSFGFLSSVSDSNSVLHTFDHISYDAFGASATRLYGDYFFHPIDCRKEETMGFQTTVHGFRSGITLPTTSVVSLETGNGDVVLYIDADAGSVSISGTIQYRIVED